MSILRTIRNRLRGVDPAYDDVTDAQLPRYQLYIDKVLAEIDIDTETAWSANRPYDKQQFFRDEATIERIIAHEAAAEGLNPAVLQVMVNQYFFADVYQRERDRDRWAYRVLHRKDVDYFPDPVAIADLLNRAS